MAEDLRRRSEDILLRANQRRPAAEAPEADRTAHAAEMREIRQTVILARDIIQRLRMAAAEGTQTADHIFSPDLSYENLSEEQAKKLKETRKEKEKAEKAESPGFRGRGRGRGRGGYGYHPYHSAPAAYAAPQYIPQQGVPAAPTATERLRASGKTREQQLAVSAAEEQAISRRMGCACQVHGRRFRRCSRASTAVDGLLCPPSATHHQAVVTDNLRRTGASLRILYTVFRYSFT